MTLKSDVYRRQILTTKVDPRAVSVIFVCLPIYRVNCCFYQPAFRVCQPTFATQPPDILELYDSKVYVEWLRYYLHISSALEIGRCQVNILGWHSDTLYSKYF